MGSNVMFKEVDMQNGYLKEYILHKILVAFVYRNPGMGTYSPTNTLR